MARKVVKSESNNPLAKVKGLGGMVRKTADKIRKQRAKREGAIYSTSDKRTY